MGFSSASIFLARKQEAVTQGGTMKSGIDHLMRGRTQGASIVKGWEDQRDLGRILDTFTYNNNDTIRCPLTPKQLNPDSPLLHPELRQGKGSRHKG